MAGADRMTIEEVVKDVMVREHSDFLRVAVEAVCAELMDGRRDRRHRPAYGRADRGPDDDRPRSAGRRGTRRTHRAVLHPALRADLRGPRLPQFARLRS